MKQIQLRIMALLLMMCMAGCRRTGVVVLYNPDGTRRGYRPRSNVEIFFEDYIWAPIDWVFGVILGILDWIFSWNVLWVLVPLILVCVLVSVYGDTENQDEGDEDGVKEEE